MNFPITHTASSASAARDGHLRLTRRGRLVFRTLPLLLVALLAAAAVMLGAMALSQPATAQNTTHDAEPSVEEITVGYGDTLWSIAGEINPEDTSRTATINQIAQLNEGLTSSDIAVGDKIFVPVYPVNS